MIYWFFTIFLWFITDIICFFSHLFRVVSSVRCVFVFLFIFLIEWITIFNHSIKCQINLN
jgi:hypothetical protein